jgi:replicative superfamily II helicase
VNDFALVSDTGYVAQNSSRILRAFFEIALSRNWGPAASVILSVCKTVDKRLWSFQNPLLQFNLPQDIKDKLEKLPREITLESIRDMDVKEVGSLIRNNRLGALVYQYAHQLPMLHLDAEISPITRTILRVELDITPQFKWNDRAHGSVEPFYIWVEDSENTEILYSEYLLISKKQSKQTQTLAFTIPIPYTSSTLDNLPPQIFVRAVSDRWIGSESVIPISFKHLILPEHNRAPHTNLLNLQPLSVTALKNPVLEEICRQRFEYFNPVQTQAFHTLYHTRENVLLGAPTGSGKTIAAELAMWSAFRDFPKSKVVYIAPLKALVKERVQDWTKRLMPLMGRSLVELTGDVTPDLKTMEKADVIITTPEKWDGVSRSWKSRNYVTSTSCVIIDEIHLLGGDRGPILEVIVSRMNFISTNTERKIRIVGLSTALANAGDLADWLGIQYVGLFNFRHSVRPVPLEIYIEGYPGKHYCPRMISMNKPAYSAILTHSPTQPVIVFVSSRRQTRLTAQDFISLCANDDNPKRFLHMTEENMEVVIDSIRDSSLKLSLQFGIGLHHAGLVEKDRQTVEELFLNGKIQVLIATSTLAWGVNLPAHLVVVKGTEFYDAKIKKYKDFPITDVLQMMGRAGRPQFDNTGVAVILVHDIKKNFYKKFLHEPFPVESSLHQCLHEHLNAEVATGTIRTKQDAMDYMTWTYLFRRVARNPTYYGCEDGSEMSVSLYLSELIEDTLQDLQKCDCVEIDENDHLSPTAYGYLASHYYLNYKTIHMLKKRLAREYRSKGNVEQNEYIHGDFSKLLRILSDALEYSELPVRHNEDLQNRDLEFQLPIPVFEKAKNAFDDPKAEYSLDSPHVKTFLLLQAHLCRFYSFPVADYVTDTISVLDQSIRVIQSMIDIAVMRGWLSLTFGLISLLQSIKQARWPTDNELLTLPHLENELLSKIPNETRLATFRNKNPAELQQLFSNALPKHKVQDIIKVVQRLPFVQVDVEVLDAKLKLGRWFVEQGKEYSFRFKVKRHKLLSDYTIHAPKFPKPQTEGWFLILGEYRHDELACMKRVSVSEDSKSYIQTTIKFTIPKMEGDRDMDVFLKSDGYFGLDVQSKVSLTIYQ